jgi:zinc protease
MTRKTTWLAALLALAALARPAFAEGDPKVPHEKYVLPNGLEVILVQDKSAPLVAVSVWYHVGSGNEVVGKSGFAHLFEHMMFQGTKNTGEDMHFNFLRKIGASTVNGTTNKDRTNYFEVVPSNQLEVALWLESERMGYLLPVLTEKSLDNQRQVVRNERRQSYDNQPYSVERFKVHELLYPEGHPYRYITIGRHEDIEGAALADVRGFFKTWYVPSNATLALAGDFEIDQAKKLVEKWFGTFPASKKPKGREVAAPATASQRVTVQDPFAKLRRVRYAWHSPKMYAPGDAELDILADALGAGGTGRLYKILVHEKQLAQSVSVSQQSSQMSSMFSVSVDLKSDADMAAVEKIVDEELARVMKEPITQREFDRAVTGIEAGFVWGLESLLARTETLQAYNHFVGSPDYITQDLDRYRKTNAAKVREVAARVLPRPARVEVVTMPADKAPDKAPAKEGK